MARGALVGIDTDASNSKTEFPQRDTVGRLVERERFVPRRVECAFSTMVSGWFST